MDQRELEVLKMQMVQILFGEVQEHFKGYGSNSGSGYGYGYGDSHGSGSGYGYGGGYGYGSSSGSGSGYGYGYGGGHGFGDGHGSGSGSGDSSKEYWASLITVFASKWDGASRTRLSILQKEGHAIAYWRSNAAGEPCNGGSGEAVKPGLVQTIKGPLRLCGSGALHATMKPTAWRGERVWIVAMKGEVIWDDDKCGALCREIIGECL